MNDGLIIKKRYMTCRKCNGTNFEIYNEEVVTEDTNDITPFALYLGASATTRFRCLKCGLENSTVGMLEVDIK